MREADVRVGELDDAFPRGRFQRLEDQLVVAMGCCDELDGRPHRSDARIITDTADALADLLVEWHGAGIDGFRLRPLVLPVDLQAITRGLVPALQARGVFRRAYEAPTLRGLLGLPRPTSRYAMADVVGASR